MDKSIPMKNVIIVDLDGTIADISHRVKWVKGGRKSRNYKKFFQECVHDKVNEWCRDIMWAMFSVGYKVIIVSARSREVEAETKVWLQDHDIMHDELHMVRNEGDYTRDTELKQQWLDNFDKDSILYVIDDRQGVVDMWRSNGLTVLQCSDWENKEKAAKKMNKKKVDSFVKDSIQKMFNS